MKAKLRRLAAWLWREWVRPITLAAAIVFPLKSALADWNYVPSGSMEPSIRPGELVLVNKLAYDLKVPFTTRHLAEWGDPARGDVVVLYSPADGERLVPWAEMIAEVTHFRLRHGIASLTPVQIGRAHV